VSPAVRPALAGLVAALLCVLAYLPGLGRQEWVGTEDFRARIAAETAAHGDWTVPTFYGTPILTKPPLAYRLLGATLGAAGEHTPRAARLLGLGALALTAALLAAAGAAAGGWRAGMVAACAHLLALNTIKNGVNAEIDPLFAAFAVAALLAWWRALEKDSAAWALLTGGAMALAALTKGMAVAPVLAAAAGGAVALRVRPRAAVLLAALLPALLGAAAWPAALAQVDPTRLTLAVRERGDFLTGWNAGAVRDTLLLPMTLLVAAFPFSLAAAHRLRQAGRAPLDRFLVGAVIAFALAVLPSATKATRYLLPCLPLLALAGALRLERLGATHRFVRGVALGAGLLAAAALPAVRETLDAAGALTLAGLALAAVAGHYLAPRRPALALALLLLPVRGLQPWVYVPAWEADGQSVAAAAEELRQQTVAVDRLAIVRLESPRLTDASPAVKRFFWSRKDLQAARENGEVFDAVLWGGRLPAPAIPGFAPAAEIHFDGRALPLLRRSD
jgi:4-amino-4-deoxy-L-arabinose transferase-like glycosyltransferase